MYSNGIFIFCFFSCVIVLDVHLLLQTYSTAQSIVVFIVFS